MKKKKPASTKKPAPAAKKPGKEQKTPKAPKAAAKPKETAEEKKKSGTVTFDEFQKIELHTGKILAAERVPDTDKLVKLTVDTGQERTIVAGIGHVYEPESLVNQMVIVVTNLKPAKLRGIRSEGMVLATGEGDSLCLVTPSKAAKPGQRVR